MLKSTMNGKKFNSFNLTIKGIIPKIKRTVPKIAIVPLVLLYIPRLNLRELINKKMPDNAKIPSTRYSLFKTLKKSKPKKFNFPKSGNMPIKIIITPAMKLYHRTSKKPLLSKI